MRYLINSQNPVYDPGLLGSRYGFRPATIDLVRIPASYIE